MSGRNEMSTTLQDPNLERGSSAIASIALIGPNATHRRVMAKALTSTEARDVREFMDYPANLGDIPHLMEEHFDVVMIDIDSDQSYAMQIIASIAAYNTSIVMAYSMRSDPDLIRDCMRAGARDFLPLPEEAAADAELAAGSELAVEPEPMIEAEPELLPEPLPEPVAAVEAEPVLNAADFLRAPEPEIFEEEAPLNPADFLLATPREVPESLSAPAVVDRPQQYSVPSRPQFVESRKPAPPPVSQPVAQQTVAPPSEGRRPEHVEHVQPEELRRATPAAAAPAKPAGEKPGAAPAKKEDDIDAWDSLWIHPALAAGKMPEHASASAAEPPAKRKAVVAAPAPPPSGPQLVQRAAAQRVEPEPVPVAAVAAAAPLFRQMDTETSGQTQRPWVRYAILGGIPLVVIGLVMMIFLPSHRSSVPPAPQEETVVPTQPAAAASSTPAAVDPHATAKPSAASRVADESAQPAPVSSSMMDAQLNAPTRISGSLKRPTAQGDAPPPTGFAPGGMDGGAALPGQFFSGARNVKVVPAVSAISAGVAEGMLTHKTTPVYPEIAKSAHVSGTVVLGANITKTGQLSNLHVLSGPAMLRNTALEAVKTWHYRPYLLNNQPVEVETTIHVVFSLDR